MDMRNSKHDNEGHDNHEMISCNYSANQLHTVNMVKSVIASYKKYMPSCPQSAALDEYVSSGKLDQDVCDRNMDSGSVYKAKVEYKSNHRAGLFLETQLQIC